jgi:hypothetical protein
MGNWDIEFKRRQDAAYEAAKALVEQKELRAREAEAEAKLSAIAEAKDKPKVTERHKKTAEAVERTKQAIKAKCQNGPLALSKGTRNSLRDELKVSDSTISRALKELRDERSN